MNHYSTAACATKLPSPVLTLERQMEENADDIDKHEGRKRSFPHERGIWASYIFVECSNIEGLLAIQDECKIALDTRTTIDIKRIDHIHLSLSKTFTIHHHNITPLVNNLQELLASRRPFRLEFSGIDVYVNEERTRTFIGVRVAETSCDTLESIVTSLDECMQQYKLPKYYTDRSFHVSILWCLDDKREEIRKHLQVLTDAFEQVYEEEYSEMSNPVRKLWFKCGNKTLYFQLA